LAAGDTYKLVGDFDEILIERRDTIAMPGAREAFMRQDRKISEKSWGFIVTFWLLETLWSWWGISTKSYSRSRPSWTMSFRDFPLAWRLRQLKELCIAFSSIVWRLRQ